MSLYDTKNDLRNIAASLPKKYEDYNIDELANGYCTAIDTNNKEQKNVYLSALILRFWYTIDKIYNRVKDLGVEREDVFERLYECIDVACKYRAWQNTDKKTTAQACINQVLASRGVPAFYFEANRPKNLGVTLSLDDMISESGDSTFEEKTADDSVEIVDSAKFMIQSLVSSDKIIEAIIADIIAYNDVFKHEKKAKMIPLGTEKFKYYEYSSEFWPFKVVQELNKIDPTYVKYFKTRYGVKNNNLFEKAIDALNSANNQKKYKFIKNSLNLLKTLV